MMKTNHDEKEGRKEGYVEKVMQIGNKPNQEGKRRKKGKEERNGNKSGVKGTKVGSNCREEGC